MQFSSSAGSKTFFYLACQADLLDFGLWTADIQWLQEGVRSDRAMAVHAVRTSPAGQEINYYDGVRRGSPAGFLRSRVPIAAPHI